MQLKITLASACFFMLTGIYPSEVADALLSDHDDKKPSNFAAMVQQAKELSLPEALNDFSFADKEISVKASSLQDFQKVLDPIADWIKSESGNLEKFLKEAGFSDPFTKLVTEDDRLKLMHQVLTSSDFKVDAKHDEAVPVDDVYDKAMMKASEKREIGEKYSKFDELFYLWLVDYIASIDDINKVKGPAIWRVKYPGKNNGIDDINKVKGPAIWRVKYPGKNNGTDLQENDLLTELDIVELAEQTNAQQKARKITKEFEDACKGSVAPADAIFEYAYDVWSGFYVKASDPKTDYEEHFYAGGHHLLEEILGSLAMMPRFNLRDDLAGVQEVHEPTGEILSPRKKISDDPNKENRCLAIEYLITKGLITRDLKLPLALLIDSCF